MDSKAKILWHRSTCQCLVYSGPTARVIAIMYALSHNVCTVHTDGFETRAITIRPLIIAHLYLVMNRDNLL